MHRSNLYLVIVASVVLMCAAIAIGQASRSRRCFNFTWLGPQYSNESREFLNATCQMATRLSSGVPCREPLVASYDGTWPDVDYIWENYRQEATCIPANNDICATYTYYFAGHVENSTYMCTRALDNFGEAITRGCYEHRVGSHVTRACFCTSYDGAMPCNGANGMSTVSTFILIALVLSVMNARLNSVT